MKIDDFKDWSLQQILDPPAGYYSLMIKDAKSFGIYDDLVKLKGGDSPEETAEQVVEPERPELPSRIEVMEGAHEVQLLVVAYLLQARNYDYNRKVFEDLGALHLFDLFTEEEVLKAFENATIIVKFPSEAAAKEFDEIIESGSCILN